MATIAYLCKQSGPVLKELSTTSGNVIEGFCVLLLNSWEQPTSICMQWVQINPINIVPKSPITQPAFLKNNLSVKTYPNVTKDKNNPCAWMSKKIWHNVCGLLASKRGTIPLIKWKKLYWLVNDPYSFKKCTFINLISWVTHAVTCSPIRFLGLLCL